MKSAEEGMEEYTKSMVTKCIAVEVLGFEERNESTEKMVQGGQNMRYGAFSTVAFIFSLLSAFPAVNSSSYADIELDYQNGLVTVEATNIPLIDFLENLSQLAYIKIYVVETIDPTQRIRLDFDERQIEKVLRSVLRGYNHAIVFNVPEIRQATVFTYNAKGNKQVKLASSETNPPVDLKEQIELASSETNPPVTLKATPFDPLPNTEEAKKNWLTRRIAVLKKRIDSGLSDKIYTQWLEGSKDPSSVVHDRDRLKAYQGQLSRLLGSAVDLLK
ncbi:MAG: hypothetical protein R6V46_18250 [Desulfatiglandaceae bacterium]